MSAADAKRIHPAVTRVRWRNDTSGRTVEVVNLLKPDGRLWVCHLFAHALRVNKPTEAPSGILPDALEVEGTVRLYQDDDPDSGGGLEIPKGATVSKFILARIWPDLRIAHYQLDGDGSVKLH